MCRSSKPRTRKKSPRCSEIRRLLMQDLSGRGGRCRCNLDPEGPAQGVPAEGSRGFAGKASHESRVGIRPHTTDLSCPSLQDRRWPRLSPYLFQRFAARDPGMRLACALRACALIRPSGVIPRNSGPSVMGAARSQASRWDTASGTTARYFNSLRRNPVECPTDTNALSRNAHRLSPMRANARSRSSHLKGSL